VTDTITDLPTEADYTAAIERLDEVWGSGANQLIGIIETVRDEETVHTTDNEAGECVDDCRGCLVERVADAVTRAVTGKAA
jgi:hypothetical protein